MIQVSNERIVALEKMMKLSKVDQTQHLKYLAKCPIEARLDLFEKQREIFYPLSQKYKESMSASDITYGSLILAIGVVRALEKNFTQKNLGPLSLDEIRDLSSLRAVAFKHKTSNISQKQEKLMGLWAIVRTLRIDHNYSYERISLFLKKKYRFSIAPSTIMKKWKELEISPEGFAVDFRTLEFES